MTRLLVGSSTTRSQAGRHRARRDNRAHWLGDEVQEWSGSVAEAAMKLPAFRRQPLALTVPDGSRSTFNWGRDLIVRKDDDVPVGVVSKGYRLVQHAAVLKLVLEALDAAGVVPADSCAVTLTTLGERMALRIRLPDDFGFDPGDGHAMGLRLDAVNSVDGSTRLSVALTWLRLVCSNGLTVRVRHSFAGQRHSESLDVRDVTRAVTHGLKDAASERELLSSWTRIAVDDRRLCAWVDGALARTWGVKAAARVHHIAMTGRDADFADPFERAKPSERAMDPGVVVPGALVPARNAFAVSQALTWIARERRDVQERLDWARSVPALIIGLVRGSRVGIAAGRISSATRE